jgi:Tfp pilus assembly protein PilV
VRTLARKESGFTVIEVLITASLVIAVSLGVGAAFDSAGATSARERARAQASAVAQQEQDRWRAKSPSALAPLVGTPQTRNITVQGRVWQVTTELAWKADADDSTSTCTGGGTPRYIQVSTTVTGAALTGAQPVRNASFVAMPPGSTGGVLRVKVTDGQSTPAPVAGVAITATPVSGAPVTVNTNANGCAMFSTLAAGTYTLSAQKLGYIDRNGITSRRSPARRCPRG